MQFQKPREMDNGVPPFTTFDVDTAAAEQQAWWAQTRRDLATLGVFDRTGEYAVNPLVVPRRIWREISDNVPRLIQAARRVVASSPDYLRWTRDDVRALILAYADKPRRPPIARPDGIFVGETLQLLELNIDSGLGGIFETDFVQHHLRLLPALAALDDESIPTGLQSMLGVIRALRETIALEQCDVAIVAYPDFPPRYLEQSHQLADAITREVRGATGHVVFPDALAGRGRWVSDDARSYQILWRDGATTHPEPKSRPMVRALFGACDTETVVMSDPADLGVDGKMALAASEAEESGGVGLSEAEAALVRKHVPWTRVVGARSVVYVGTAYDLPTLLRERQHELVLKRTQSKSGQHFFSGAEQPVTEWQARVEAALTDSIPWVVQRNVRSSPVDFCYMDESGNTRVESQRYLYSPYVFGDRCGPALIRVERDPQNRRVGLPATSPVAMAGTVIG